MKKIKKYLTVIFGFFLLAISFNFFQAPFNFAPGGVAGFAILVHKIFGLNETYCIFFVNIVLIILSYIILGKEKTRNTILGSILFPFFIEITEPLSRFFPINELDYLLIAVMGGTLSGLGLGLAFKNGFTSGGTDILNQIIEDKFKIPISKSLIYVDGSIVILSAIVFDIPTMIYSFLLLIIMSIISNKTILELDNNKVFYIYTKEPEKIKKYLIESFSYDLTIFNTIGGYTKEPKKMYMCSVSTKDYYVVKEGILYIDPHAFIVIANAYEQKNANVLICKANN